ncbi:unnamed protein product [Amoebophrya sp. A120]|nr:unnamed protein product [Amoebophrya sp. A120]|eukprot:GSA120T00016021001.1
MSDYSRSRSRSARKPARRQPSRLSGSESPPPRDSKKSRRSPRRSRDRKEVSEEPTTKEEIRLTDNDAAFVLGKNGKTKVKIGKASGIKSITLDDLTLRATGPKTAVKRAIKYARFLMAQRAGPVVVNKKEHDEGDLTLLDVPNAAIGFVTGKGGNFLRAIEDEWNVLMFFAEYEGRTGMQNSIETLAIFGADRRNRRGAELKVLSAIESKVPNWFEDHKEDILGRDVDGEDWRSGVMPFSDDSQLSFALGKNGATRRKLERASGCLLQYIGNIAIFTGDRVQRRTLRQYMKWLFAQLDGPVDVPDAADRDDCTMLKIPQDCVGYITGARRAALSTIEMDFGCLMFFTGSKNDKAEFEWLAIFGGESERKGAELKVKSSVESKSKGYYSSDLKQNKKDWDKPGFSTDIMYMADDDIGYCLGKGGSTRVKLANASGCHLQYIGQHALIAGSLERRRNCRDYIKWLLEQRDSKNGKMDVDASGRDDINEFTVPHECIGWVTGKQGTELRKVEEQTKTFCFLARDPKRDGKERLLICGLQEGSRNEIVGRMGAQKLVEDLVREKQTMDYRESRRGGRDRRDSRAPRGRRDSRGGGRREERGRSRDAPRYEERGRGRRDSGPAERKRESRGRERYGGDRGRGRY